jgi:hypothetical protein
MNLPDPRKVTEAGLSWFQSIRHNPFKTTLLFLLFLAVTGAGVFLSAFISEKAKQLAQVSEKVEKLESSISKISLALETLVVSEVVTSLDGGDTILLRYDPLPQSLKVIQGPLIHLPRPEYGYELQGKTLKITSDLTLEMITSQLEKGGVTVEYIRKISLENDN